MVAHICNPTEAVSAGSWEFKARPIHIGSSWPARAIWGGPLRIISTNNDNKNIFFKKKGTPRFHSCPNLIQESPNLDTFSFFCMGTCMCVCAHTCACIGQRSIPEVFLSHSPPWFFSLSFSLLPRTGWFCQAGWPWAPGSSCAGFLDTGIVITE